MWAQSSLFCTKNLAFEKNEEYFTITPQSPKILMGLKVF